MSCDTWYQIYHGYHLISYMNATALCCLPETNVILYAYYKEQFIRKREPGRETQSFQLLHIVLRTWFGTVAN